ncbi:DUF4389 domain-containing protein [Candidatus Woesearchaeota archaeon]|nr:DUF4389 domain-containing protein [Candidatus Woesearchaeota archaeon]
MSERKEAWLRIVVVIISGLILGIWKSLIQILALIHWVVVVVGGKRNKSLADFCEIWNTQLYTWVRYLTFVSNKRPFPFSGLTKNLSEFEKK